MKLDPSPLTAVLPPSFQGVAASAAEAGEVIAWTAPVAAAAPEAAIRNLRGNRRSDSALSTDIAVLLGSNGTRGSGT